MAITPKASQDSFKERLNRCPICRGTGEEKCKEDYQECTECQGFGRWYKDRR